MDLFSQLIDPTENQLPKDGIVNYYGGVIPYEKADYFFDKLINTIDWQNDIYYISGKKIVTNRQIAWYGDTSFELRYSNTNKSGNVWTEDLLELKNIVEEKTAQDFNSCLLNLYHTGEDGLGWHSDGDKEAVIASLSFGANRKFLFKHKITKEKVGFHLGHGDLLVMKGMTQKYWMHHLPPTKKVKSPRINLTFRKSRRVEENLSEAK